MTKAQAKKLLKELMEHVDYDLYKDMFVYDERENLDEYIEIILKHVNKNEKEKK